MNDEISVYNCLLIADSRIAEYGIGAYKLGWGFKNFDYKKGTKDEF